MKELLDYDTAASQFYKKSNFTYFSLSAWDLSGVFFDETCREHKSLNELKVLASRNKWKKEPSYHRTALDEGLVIVVTDPNLKIVHTTSNITKMNGYTPEEVKGKSPNIFQGEQTDKRSKAIIYNAIRQNKPFETTLVNYRKDGSIYKCWIKAEPIFNKKGILTNFIAYEKAVA
jgi:PAS domain S-box-containing protein